MTIARLEANAAEGGTHASLNKALQPFLRKQKMCEQAVRTLGTDQAASITKPKNESDL